MKTRLLLDLRAAHRRAQRWRSQTIRTNWTNSSQISLGALPSFIPGPEFVKPERSRSEMSAFVQTTLIADDFARIESGTTPGRRFGCMAIEAAPTQILSLFGSSIVRMLDWQTGVRREISWWRRQLGLMMMLMMEWRRMELLVLLTIKSSVYSIFLLNIVVVPVCSCGISRHKLLRGIILPHVGESCASNHGMMMLLLRMVR